MSKNLNALDASDQVQFDHLAGSGGTGTDSAGFVGLSKVVYGPDLAAPTRVTPATPLPTTVPSGLSTIAATFNRPADTTAYAIGDLIAASATAAAPIEVQNAVRAAGQGVRLERCRLRKTSPTLSAASFRVHVFRQLPTLTVNDNGVFNAANILALSDITGYVGYFDIGMDLAAVAGASGRGVPAVGSGMTTDPSSGTSLYVIIEARAAYVPASGETFSIVFECQWS